MKFLISPVLSNQSNLVIHYCGLQEVWCSLTVRYQGSQFYVLLYSLYNVACIEHLSKHFKLPKKICSIKAGHHMWLKD